MRGDFHNTLWSVKRRRSQRGRSIDEARDAPVDDLGETHVLVARSCAFLVDLLIVAIIGTAIFTMLVVAGLFTFGASWFLLPLAFPLTALLYNAFTVAGAGRGTLGMRAMGLEVVDTHGEPVDFIVAAAHALLFYVSLSFPPILLFGLFNDEHRLLHDWVTAVVVRKRG